MLKISIFALGFILFSSTAFSQANIAAQKCSVALNSCGKSSGGISKVCVDQYEACLKDNGVVQRSNGEYVQAYNPSSPVYQYCRNQGLNPNGSAFAKCVSSGGATGNNGNPAQDPTAQNQPTGSGNESGQTTNNPIVACQNTCNGDESCKAGCLSDNDGAGGGSSGQVISEKIAEPVVADTAVDPKLQAQAEKALSECASNSDSAGQTCDDKTNPNMTSLSSQMQSLGAQFGAQASSVASACKTMGTISAVASAGILAYQTDCVASIGSCKSSCGEYISLVANNPALAASFGTSLSDAQSRLAKCDDLTSRKDLASQAMTNLTNTGVNAKACKELAQGSNLDAICAKTPDFPGCTAENLDCSSPALASNKVCACKNAPGSDACTGKIDVANNSSSSSGDVDTTGINFGGDLNDTPEIGQGDAKKITAAGVDGKGNGSAMGASNSGDTGSSGSARNGSTAAAEKTGILSGFFGGGGKGFLSALGFGSPAPAPAFRNPTSVPAKKTAAPDLRQFLPGGKFYKGRNAAGMTGPDGITGPNSDLWLKINNRYNALSETLTQKP